MPIHFSKENKTICTWFSNSLTASVWDLAAKVWRIVASKPTFSGWLLFLKKQQQYSVSGSYNCYWIQINVRYIYMHTKRKKSENTINIHVYLSNLFYIVIRHHLTSKQLDVMIHFRWRIFYLCKSRL